MVWIKAAYEFASPFSYRIPDFSPQYALSSLLPGPSAIKLAVVSTAIETTGNIKYGEEIFEIIKNVDIKIQLPKKIAVTNVIIKRLKKKKGSKNEFEKTFGIRGYVHFPERFTIYLDITESKVEEIKKVLKNIRRFGTSDSLVWCIEISEENPAGNIVSPVENLEKENKNTFIIPVKDIKPEADFASINIYNTKKRNKKVLIEKFYLLKISNQLQGENWIVYEFS